MLSYFAFISVPLVVFMLFSFRAVSRHYEEQARFSADQAFEQAYTFVSTRMGALVKASDVVYFGAEVQKVLTRDRASYERDLVQQNIDMVELDRFLSDFRNSEDVFRVSLFVPGWLSYANQGINFENLDTLAASADYARLLASREKVLWLPAEEVVQDADPTRQVRVIPMLRKIRNFEKLSEVIGVMRISILERNMLDILEKANVSRKGAVLIVDAQGRDICGAGLDEAARRDLSLSAVAAGSDLRRSPLDSDGVRYAASSRLLPGSDWALVAAVPLSDIRYGSAQILNVMLALIGAIALLSYFAAAFFSRSATRRIVELTRTMNLVKDRSLGDALPAGSKDEIGQLIDSYNYMLRRMQALIEAQYEAGRSVKSAELRALQAQINPHFLYNALDMINWKAMERGAPEVARISRSLARFYYLSLGDGKDFVPFSDELANVEAYMQIMGLRFEDRITFKLDVADETRRYGIPKLVLQPLVENAIVHGILEKEGGAAGSIELGARLEAGCLVARVDDDGVGMSDEQLSTILSESRTKERHGYGVRNVNERIVLSYGTEYGLEYSRRPGGGTRVELRIPAILYEENGREGKDEHGER
jgi:Predicted signal transduction protein with a C-terminal ATPase domain